VGHIISALPFFLSPPRLFFVSAPGGFDLRDFSKVLR